LRGAKQSIQLRLPVLVFGFLLGVTTPTGLGFKFSGASRLATELGTGSTALVPFGLNLDHLGYLFFRLILVAIAL